MRLCKCVLAVLLLSISMLSLLVGCTRNQNGDDEPSGTVFVPDTEKLPSGISDIRNLVYAYEKLYFISIGVSEAEPYETVPRLFSINPDSTNLTEYTLDTPDRAVQDRESEAYEILSICADEAGNLWVLEAQPQQDYDSNKKVMTVHKLDRSGADITSVELNAISDNYRISSFSAFNMDNAGNIYISVLADGVNRVFVLSEDGIILFSLDADNYTGGLGNLIRMADGFVAFFGSTDVGLALREIDFSERAWGNRIELPDNANRVFAGGIKHDVVYCDPFSLYSLEASSGESTKILDWISSGVEYDSLVDVILLPDGRILCASQTPDTATGSSGITLSLLTETPVSELEEKTILTLAAFSLDSDIMSAIVEFNNTSDTHSIRVVDYSEFSTGDDWWAGLIKLSTEITSGNFPDLFVLGALPYKQYAEKGLLEDLYNYIDSDAELDRNDFMESILRAYEIDGGLYQIAPSFTITTVVGHPSVVGEGFGWNMDEFRTVLDANPQADMPMGNLFDKRVFLQMTLSSSMDEYVDWNTGVTDFDSAAFIALLEFTDAFPTEREYGLTESALIASGKQIIADLWFGDFDRFKMYRTMFGGEIAFKGYPAENRMGSYASFNSGLAITSGCTDKETAWEFIRSFLIKDWQLVSITSGFPTNKSAFDEKAREAMTGSSRTTYYGNIPIEITAMSQSDVDMFLEFLDFISNKADLNWHVGLMDIIMEGANDYFNGLVTAKEAARVIQSRASMYVAEQG